MPTKDETRHSITSTFIDKFNAVRLYTSRQLRVGDMQEFDRLYNDVAKMAVKLHLQLATHDITMLREDAQKILTNYVTTIMPDMKHHPAQTVAQHVEPRERQTC